jgi:16S rRNA G966 N2-methylase RsmD
MSGLDILTPEAIVVAEHDLNHEPAESFGPLKRVDRREYGSTAVSFYEAKEGMP